MRASAACSDACGRAGRELRVNVSAVARNGSSYRVGLVAVHVSVRLGGFKRNELIARAVAPDVA